MRGRAMRREQPPMIRKAVIVVLTLGAVSTTFMWVLSHQFRLSASVRPPRDDGSEVSALLRGDAADGVLTIVLRLPATVPPGQVVGADLQWGDGFRYRDQRVQLPFYTDAGPNGMRPARIRRVHLPGWVPALAFAAYPVFAFIRGPLRRWRRRRRGLCVNCAYDLTGNVSGVCSECGTKIESR